MLMADVLSQDEIKVPLGGVSHQPQSDDHAIMDAIKTGFRHFFAKDLHGFTHTPAELSTSSSFTARWVEYNYATPAALRIDAVLYSPIVKPVLLALDVSLVRFIMDCFFGGSGEYNYQSEKQDLSFGETHIARLILAKITTSLEQAGLPLTEFKFKLQLSSTDLWVNKRIFSQEAVAILTTEIKVNSTQGNLQIFLPTSLLTLPQSGQSKPG